MSSLAGSDQTAPCDEPRRAVPHPSRERGGAPLEWWRVPLLSPSRLGAPRDERASVLFLPLCHVLYEMKSVGGFHGVWSTLTGSRGRISSTVTASSPDLWVILSPDRGRFGLAVSDTIRHGRTRSLDQNGSSGSSTTHSDLIDASMDHRCDGIQRQNPDATKDRWWRRVQSQTSGTSRSHRSTGRQAT